jgi:hypothetical protein
MPLPSLIDEWFGVTYSGPALHALLHGHFFSSGLDFSGRYRPAYTAIWNYAQWHVPEGFSMTSAAGWGMLRIAVFLVAVWVLTSWLIGHASNVPRPLLWLAPAAVALTPGIADDLARYGPGDPMMVAGLIIGLAMIGAGVRRLAFDAQASKGHASAAAAVIALGYLVYLVGVYSKEASFCLLAFVPFFLIWLATSDGRYAAPRSRKVWVLLVGLAVLLVAPLLHVATHLALSLTSGERPYPAAEHSLVAKVYAAGLSPLFGYPPVLQTWLWFAAAPGAIIVVVTTARRREPEAWLLLGVLTTGFLMTSLALARGEIGSWYYIPWIVAVAAVGTRGLARTNMSLFLGIAALVAVTGVSGTRTALADWAHNERSGSTAVEIAKGVVNASCPLYLTSFDIERRVAIPLLFRHAQARPIESCSPSSSEAYALSWANAPLSPQFAARCTSRWQSLGTVDELGTYRCRSLSSAAVPDQNAASGYPKIQVVALHPSTQLPRPRTLFQPAP